MLSFNATGIPYRTPDGCASLAWASSDFRTTLVGVRSALSRLAFPRRVAVALALASASTSVTLHPPRPLQTRRAWAPGRSLHGRRERNPTVCPRAAAEPRRRRADESRPVRE